MIFYLYSIFLGHITYNRSWSIELQAAAEPNPFFGLDPVVGSVGAGAAAGAATASGDTHKKTPMRPPPPHSAAVVAAATSSPAKTAFDDLNDSIRMAMGSPAKQQQQQQVAAGGVCSSPAKMYTSLGGGAATGSGGLLCRTHCFPRASSVVNDHVLCDMCYCCAGHSAQCCPPQTPPTYLLLFVVARRIEAAGGHNTICSELNWHFICNPSCTEQERTND